IALLLTRFPAYTGRLYAFDLCGAALGCIVVIVALKLLDPIAAMLGIATTVAAVGWSFRSKNENARLRKRATVTVGILALAFAAQSISYFAGSPLLRITWGKQSVFTEVPIMERWNTYSRVAVWDYMYAGPFGWGFGLLHTDDIPQKYVNIDADAATIMTAF